MALLFLLKSANIDVRGIYWVLSIVVVFTLSRYLKFIQKPNFIIILYFIFPMMLDLIQIRNTFMFFTIALAIFEYTIGNKIRSLILLLLSLLLHSFSLAFVCSFVVIILLKEKRIVNVGSISVNEIKFRFNTKLYIGILFLGMINIVFGGKLVLFILSGGYTEQMSRKLSNYIVMESNIFTFGFWGSFLLADLIIFYISINRYWTNIKNRETQNVITMLYFMIFSGFLLLGSSVYLTDIGRYYRGLFVFKCILYGCIEKYMNNFTVIVFRTYLLLSAALLIIVYYYRILPYGIDIFNNSLLRLGH